MIDGKTVRNMWSDINKLENCVSSWFYYRNNPHRNFARRLITICCTLVPNLIGALEAFFFVRGHQSCKAYFTIECNGCYKRTTLETLTPKLGNCHHYVTTIYNFKIILLLLWRSLQIKYPWVFVTDRTRGPKTTGKVFYNSTTATLTRCLAILLSSHTNL
jgi:hypothetical protein